MTGADIIAAIILTALAIAIFCIFAALALSQIIQRGFFCENWT